MSLDEKVCEASTSVKKAKLRASSLAASKALDDSESAIASLFPIVPPHKRSDGTSEQSHNPNATADLAVDNAMSIRHLAAAAYEGSTRAVELYAAQHATNFLSRVHPAYFPTNLTLPTPTASGILFNFRQ